MLIQPGSTRSTVRSSAVAGAVELEPRVDEVGRAVAAGDRPRRLGEEVEPGRVEPAAEREVGREAPPVVEGGEVVEADDQQDVRRVAGDEVHQPAHACPPLTASA